MTQKWNPESYARSARFVSDLGAGVVDLLDPQPDEDVLDLGCGDGALTESLVQRGCNVIGVDASAEQTAAARARGLDARVVDARALPFENAFDAVFTNATLHWIEDIASVLTGVMRALRPRGRFVGEFGGAGNVRTAVDAFYEALDRRGVEGAKHNPWFFRGLSEFQRELEECGFEIGSIILFPRPTTLPGTIEDWIDIFCQSFLTAVPEAERPGLVREVAAALRPKCYTEAEGWVLDYVRLRFQAGKPR